MDFKDYLDKTAKELYREVEKILSQWLKEVEKTDKKLVPLAKAFIKACKGGKRIRGTLVKLGYEIAQVHLRGATSSHLGGVTRLEGGILQVGAAYEIAHAAILAHDDIIDESPLRRDQSSLHQVLGGNHHGISQAISLGDLGFFLSVKIISESKFPEKEKIQALNYFSKVMMDTALGEMLELEKGKAVVVAKLKTARYTISGPLILGIILGGGNDKLVRKLEEFGENLGIAYQIKDDILDRDGYARVSLTRAKNMAEKYKDQALKILPSITKAKKMSKLLMQMAGYLIERNK